MSKFIDEISHPIKLIYFINIHILAEFQDLVLTSDVAEFLFSLITESIFAMSGVFWEAEKQPNLCEAASGFTLSTLNLMVAVPMAVVDLLVSLTLSLASLAMVLLSPLLELVTAGFTMILAALGLEDWTRDQTLVTMAVVTILAGIWHQHRYGTCVISQSQT